LKKGNMTRIYAIINKLNLKMYIGQTCKTLARRFNTHLSVARKGDTIPFHQALRKYGRDAFEIVEIANTEDREYGHFLERLYIAFYGTYGNLGYNASAGGEAPAFGMRHTKQWCEQHSKRMSEEKHPLFGTIVSEETKKKMSATRRGKLVKPEITNEQVITLYLSGLGSRAIAKRLNVMRETIRARLRSQNIESHPSGRPKGGNQ
jgi:group I intron endonuclease